MLHDGYSDLPVGKIASIVTFLEMRERPAASRTSAPQDMKIRCVPQPDLGWYRQLYRRVGEEWLWFSRLLLNDDDLRAVLWNERLEVFALSVSAEDKGLLELDRRVPGEVEIAYFGVSSDLIGKGAGRFLLHHALEQAWSHNPRRVWLHTCNLDHPRALEFYQKAGFAAYKFAIEVSDDPRLTGLLPMNAAPQLPIIR
jgi:GNAT superfamily N-acetyltransferase